MFLLGLLMQTVLNKFLSNLVIVGFVALEFGINIRYPGVALDFFKNLLSYINFDLLEQFSFFDLPLEPDQFFSEPLTPNFGWIGFETCSIFLNMGTLCWILIFDFVVFLLLLFNCKCITNNCMPKPLG